METPSVHLQDQAAGISQPAPEDSAAPAAPTQARARLRPLWMLGRAGWGILLGLGLVFAVAQVLIVSQGPTDFCTDYVSAQRVLQGLQPYIPLHCSAGAASFPNGLHEYDTHPPSSVLLLLPFALLPMSQATLIWGVCALAAYLVTGALLLKELGWYSLRGAALFMLGSVLWLPFLFSETFLNFEQLLTLLVLVAWLLARRKRDGWSGWLLGMAGLLKLWPAALLLLPFIERRWRAALVGGVTLACGALLALVVVGPAAYAAYLGPVRLNETLAAPSDANVSLVGTVARLWTGIPQVPPLLPGLSVTEAMLLAEGLAVLLLAGVLALLWRCHRHGPSEAVELLSQGLLVTALLLAFPITWYWMLITLLLPCAAMLLALRQLSRPPRWWWALAVSGLFLEAGPGWAAIRLPIWLSQVHIASPASWQLLVIGLPTVGLVCFAAAQAWLLWQASISQAKQASRPSASISMGKHSAKQYPARRLGAW
ncbi:MAG TPA: glycosyltransferase family 87 protein [Ktedonobacterales bacterium]|nr:glycosyltransferase family 87 protein [Ktedonobacterales bacterium]